MKPKDTIQITPATARFNEAVEAADQVLGYEYDRLKAELLWYQLLRAGKSCEAWNLFRAGTDLGYFKKENM